MTQGMHTTGGLSRGDPLEAASEHAAEDNGAIELGTVGWADRDTHYDLGTVDNDGVTLVCVTLFRGKGTNETLTPDVAQGRKILARIDSSRDGIPAKGKQVLVARPAGFGGPGMWHVLHEPGPTTMFPNGPKAGDRLLSGYGGTFIRQGGDGTVSIVTTDDGTKDGKSIYAQVRRDGFRFVGPWGKLTLDANGLQALHHAGASIRMGGIGGLPPPLDTLGAYASILAPIVKIEATAIALGSSAGVPDTLAKSTALLAVLGEIATAITQATAALAVANVAFTPNPSPAGVAALATFNTAVGLLGTAATALTASVAAAALTIPSTSTSAT